MLLYTILHMFVFLLHKVFSNTCRNPGTEGLGFDPKARAFSKTYFKFAKHKPNLKYDPNIAHICKQPARINLAGKPCRYTLPLASCPLNTVNPR